MAAYDIFLKNEHSDRISQLMIKNNKRLITYLCKTFKKPKAKVLEIGPGKGYFKQAVLDTPTVLNIMLWTETKIF